MHAHYARGLRAASRCNLGITSIHTAREKCRIRPVGTCIRRVLCVSPYALVDNLIIKLKHREYLSHKFQFHKK